MLSSPPERVRLSPFRGVARLPRTRAWIPLLTVGSLVLALALGLGSAHLAVTGDFPFGRVRVGPWSFWPRLGSRDVDPYARAILARRGEIPLATGEGLELRATSDDAGRPLEGQCVYRISGSTPQARFWTLAIYGGAGNAAGPGRHSLVSSEILRDEAGRFDIVLASDVAPGNWIAAPASGQIVLVLRLYDTPVSAGGPTLDARALPRILREGCEA
jgi:hypothetical protein